MGPENQKVPKAPVKIKQQKLNCFYTNADQLRNKMSELTLRVRNEKPMVVGVTEVKPKNHNVIGSEKQLPPEE